MRINRLAVRHADSHVDLVPLIDCVFLLLLFFMLCGRISTDQRPEQVTVPPARTAVTRATDLPRLVVSLRGGQGDAAPLIIQAGADRFVGVAGERAPFVGLRRLLDRAWERAERRPDGSRLLLELRADADCDMRTVQEVMALAADTWDAGTGRPRSDGPPRRPLTDIAFTARQPGG